MQQQVQWFPGHMAKTRRKISEDLRLVDIVAELLDARIPQSSSNPVLRDIIRNKPRVVVLNKSDLADPKQTARWVAACKEQGLRAIPVESKTGKGLPALYSAIREELKEQISNWERKGMTGRPIRVMVLVCWWGAAQERRRSGTSLGSPGRTAGLPLGKALSC